MKVRSISISRIWPGLVILFWAVGCPVCCWAQEKLSAFVENPPGFAEEFDSPKDLDPLIPEVQDNFRIPDKLLPTWLDAFRRDEQDLKRLVAESIADAHRGGENLDIMIVPLLEEFRNPSSSRLTAEAVASALVELNAKEAAEALFDKAGDASWSLSLIIEPALAKWQYQRMEAVWVERLNEETPDGPRQRLAIECLGILKSEAAVDPLIKLAQSKFTSATTRIAAANALAEIPGSGHVALAENLFSLQRQTLVDRLVAAKVLRLQTGKSASDMLIELTKDRDTSVAFVAVRNHFEIDPQAVKPLAAELAGNPNANIRSVAVKAFAHESTDSDVRGLIELLKDHDPPVRREARELLELKAKNGEFAELIDGAMIDILRNANAETDWRQLEQAIRYVGELDRKQAAPLLVKYLRADRNQVFLPAAWSLRKLSVEETFEDCLVFINQRVKKLGNQLADPYLETQLSQLCQMFGLSKYEPAADGLKSFVPKAVKNRGTQARAAAIWSLGHIYEDRPQPELAVVLVDRLSDVDINNPELFPVRAASAVAIARMNNQDQLEALREWLKKESPKGMIGYSCAWGINRLTGEPIPALKPVNYKKLGWFLTPFSKS